MSFLHADNVRNVHKLLHVSLLLQELHGDNRYIVRAPDKRGYRGEFKDNFSYFSMKTYVVTPH